MNEWRIAQGAQVVDEAGEALGVVEQIDETEPPFLLVRTHREGRAVRVPLTAVDEAASTSNRIVIPTVAEALGAAQPGREAAASGTLEAGTVTDAFTIPVVAEQAFATVHEAEQGRAVIEKHVELVPHEATVQIGTDEIEVERVPIDRQLATPPSVRQEGDTIIIPVVEEILVVEKRYLLREEVRVTRRRAVREETLREDLRREVVEVREERYDEVDDAPGRV